MKDFIIKHEKPIPRDEQETTITHDKDVNTWSFFTNNPTHARKWEDAIIVSDRYLSVKVYHSGTGDLISIAGEINGTASINRKREMTEEQRQAASDRMKSMHKQNTI